MRLSLYITLVLPLKKYYHNIISTLQYHLNANLVRKPLYYDNLCSKAINLKGRTNQAEQINKWDGDKDRVTNDRMHRICSR